MDWNRILLFLANSLFAVFCRKVKKYNTNILHPLRFVINKFDYFVTKLKLNEDYFLSIQSLQKIR